MLRSVNGLLFFLLYIHASSVCAADGLTREEYARFSPPAPQSIRVYSCEAGALVTWAPPAAPTAKRMGYDRRLAFYRVYRKKHGEESFEKIGLTTSTGFIDRELAPGVGYEYVVTAVHKGGTESGYSMEVELVPR